MNPIVIIGSGHAGLNVAREVRANDAEVPVVMLSKTEICAYYKPNLSKAMAMGKTAEQLVMKTVEALAGELNADLRSFVDVHGIDAENKQVHYQDQQGVAHIQPYDSLVLATGAVPIRLPIEKQTDVPFLTINDLDDYRHFRQVIAGKKHVTIIGAGFVGCEIASDLNSQDYKVDVIDKAQWPLQRVIPEIMGSAIKNAMRENGTQWHFGVVMVKVEQRGDRIQVTLSDNSQIETDLIVSAVGLVSNTQLAEKAGLSTARGIIVDQYSRTSNPFIYALGDCVQYGGTPLPFIAPATQAAKALGKTITGTPTPFVLPPLAVAVKISVCPTVICPASSGKGIWEVQGAGNDLEAHFFNEHGQICGFALTGNTVARKAALAKQCQQNLQDNADCSHSSQGDSTAPVKTAMI